MTDAEIVLNALIRDVARYYADDVQLHALWIEGEGAVCVVYSRRIDSPPILLGRRFRFPPHARENDPDSTGADCAEQLTEPPGTLWEAGITDEHGVKWLAVPSLPIAPYGG
jgi:hypothetical protein